MFSNQTVPLCHPGSSRGPVTVVIRRVRIKFMASFDYEQQLKMLSSMGFTDRTKNLDSLMKAKGKINEAIGYLSGDTEIVESNSERESNNFRFNLDELRKIHSDFCPLDLYSMDVERRKSHSIVF